MSPPRGRISSPEEGEVDPPEEGEVHSRALETPVRPKPGPVPIKRPPSSGAGYSDGLASRVEPARKKARYDDLNESPQRLARVQYPPLHSDRRSPGLREHLRSPSPRILARTSTLAIPSMKDDGIQELPGSPQGKTESQDLPPSDGPNSAQTSPMLDEPPGRQKHASADIPASGAAANGREGDTYAKAPRSFLTLSAPRQDPPQSADHLAEDIPWPGLPLTVEQGWKHQWEDPDFCRGATRNAATRPRMSLVQRRKLKYCDLADRVYKGCSTLGSYEIAEMLGEGTFGVVVKGKQIVTGREVALKRVTIHDAKDGLALTTIREIKFLKTLRHPNIVPVIDMVVNMSPAHGQPGRDEIFMVEPYMDHDLAGLLAYHPLEPPQIKLYMQQLCDATAFLHHHNVVHRDIKAANLLINNKGQLQVADFGLARSVLNPKSSNEKPQYTGTVVTRWYRPPEVLAGRNDYGPEIDMWGLGCILAEMFFREPYFKGTSEVHQIELIAEKCGSPNDVNLPGWSKLHGVRNADSNGRVDETAPDGRKDFGHLPRTLKAHLTRDGKVSIPLAAADLIDKLLVLDPQKRLTAPEACQHHWLWNAPFPADPASLPKYEPRKEHDKKKEYEKGSEKEKQDGHEKGARLPADQQWHQRQPPKQSYEHIQQPSHTSRYDDPTFSTQAHYQPRPPPSMLAPSKQVPSQGSGPRLPPTGRPSAAAIGRMTAKTAAKGKLKL